MKSFLTPVAAVLMAVSTTLTASADMNRSVETHAYEMLGQARELRWLIHDNETQLPNARLLCNEVEDVYRQIRDFDDSVFRERNTRFLAGDLQRIESSLMDLQNMLSRCGTPVPSAHPNFSFGDARFSVGKGHRGRQQSIVPVIVDQANRLMETVQCTKTEIDRHNGHAHVPVPAFSKPVGNPGFQPFVPTQRFSPQAPAPVNGPQFGPQHDRRDVRYSKPVTQTTQSPFIEWNGYRISFSPKHN